MSIAGTLNLGVFKRVLGKPETPESLMQKYAKTGKPCYLEDLYNLYSDRIYHFILTLSPLDNAADITQRTWIKVIEKRHLYRNKNMVQAWLFTLARNTLFDELRKEKRWVYEADIEDQISQTEKVPSFTHFHSALKNLPFKQKEALSLYLEGFSMEEIAKICGCPKETIKTRIRYGKDMLKQLMSNEK